ncbi:hypothetical protein [Pedobacter suwonensis]|nr:hypothetical protein [uncultured Pedobacter sp.]
MENFHIKAPCYKTKNSYTVFATLNLIGTGKSATSKVESRANPNL